MEAVELYREIGHHRSAGKLLMHLGRSEEAAKEFAGKNVKLSGKAATQAGVKGIEVHSVESM